MSSKKLTILFAPISAHGHVNACLGIAQVLQKRGHHVIFAISKNCKNLMTKENFDAEFYEEPEFDPKLMFEHTEKLSPTLRLSPIGIIEENTLQILGYITSSFMSADDQYRDIINKVNPDIIIVDSSVCSPALINSKPWVLHCSIAPLYYLPDERAPPAFSGLPIKGPRNEWDEFRTKYEELMRPLHEKFNQWVISKGAPPIPKYGFHPHSPYLNIYMFPEEIDYTDLRPLPPKWHRFDTFMRESNEPFEIPEKLKNKNGKLIYASIGTMMSTDLSLMNLLVNHLKDIPHRFIISLGDYFDANQLGDNMWGAPMVPQLSVLPLVDLVICHGGNNTVTESFYYGKPMIVFPFLCDQIDNAQTIDENGYGKRLNLFTVTKEEVSNAIEKLLNDEDLYKRLDIISKKIQLSNGKERAADLIEKIVN